MRYCTAAVVSLFALLALRAQSSLSQADVIRRMIETGSYDGWMTKELGTMGDAAAVEITRVLGDRTPTPGDILISEVILDHAFADPRAVPNVTDREPRTALFVLRSFESTTSDPKVKAGIQEARDYISKRVKEAAAK